MESPCSRVRQRARTSWGWALGRRGSERRLAGRSGGAWKSGEEKIGHGDPVSCTNPGNRNVACQAESKQCGIVVGQRFGPTCDCSAAEQRDCRRFSRPNLVARQFQGRRSCHIFASTLLHAPTPAYTSRDKNPEQSSARDQHRRLRMPLKFSLQTRYPFPSRDHGRVPSETSI